MVVVGYGPAAPLPRPNFTSINLIQLICVALCLLSFSSSAATPQRRLAPQLINSIKKKREIKGGMKGRVWIE